MSSLVFVVISVAYKLFFKETIYNCHQFWLCGDELKRQIQYAFQDTVFFLGQAMDAHFYLCLLLVKKDQNKAKMLRKNNPAIALYPL
jgi:hypothetical protein